MKGHEQLLAMRRAGRIPGVVFFDLDPCGLESWGDWIEQSPHRASVQIEPADKRPDLRFAIGLTCCVSGEDAARVRSVRDALIGAKAKRVIASIFEVRGEGEFRTFHLIECTDTAGQMQGAEHG